jgi:hypothetical protein
VRTGSSSSRGCVLFLPTLFHVDTDLFSLQLLNRNPKHRLGAQRDAAELKEHPFFASIDWDLLSQRKIPPPFKPYVDSDESVANFDPEFTEANLFDEAPHDIDWDDADPSPNWLDRASELSKARHEEEGMARPMEIKAQRKERPAVAPLSTSVQENFRSCSSLFFPYFLSASYFFSLSLHYRRLHFLRRGRVDDSQRRRFPLPPQYDGRRPRTATECFAQVVRFLIVVEEGGYC